MCREKSEQKVEEIGNEGDKEEVEVTQTLYFSHSYTTHCD